MKYHVRSGMRIKADGFMLFLMYVTHLHESQALPKPYFVFPCDYIAKATFEEAVAVVIKG